MPIDRRSRSSTEAGQLKHSRSELSGEPGAVHWAGRSRLQPFRRFAQLIRGHLDGILAWTTLKVSNSALAGLNNAVKAISHRAYGYRTVDAYITAIWHGLGDLPLE